MTWDAVAAEHVGHRAVLRSPRELECVDCTRKLVLPRDPGGETATPPLFRPLGRPDLKPMPAWLKPAVSAELAARKHSRTTPPDPEETP